MSAATGLTTPLASTVTGSSDGSEDLEAQNVQIVHVPPSSRRCRNCGVAIGVILLIAAVAGYIFSAHRALPAINPNENFVDVNINRYDLLDSGFSLSNSGTSALAGIGISQGAIIVSNIALAIIIIAR